MLGGRYYPMGVFTPVYPISDFPNNFARSHHTCRQFSNCHIMSKEGVNIQLSTNTATESLRNITIPSNDCQVSNLWLFQIFLDCVDY